MLSALGNLPGEMVQNVGRHLDDGDLSSLSWTCSDMHKLLTEILYKRHILNHELMYYSVERTAYLETACCASPAAFGNSGILGSVLESANPNVVLPMAAVTPSHLCLAQDDHPSASAIDSFWGTTPLEWAISNSSRYRVSMLLGVPIRSSLRKLDHPQQEIVQLRYIRAACRRHDPEVIALLLQHELPLQLRDDEGNSFLSIFCQTIESTRPADLTVEKSAKCVVALLKGGADPQQKNDEGVSALDYIRRMMTYEGPSHFHQEVAKAWNEALILDGEGVRERR
ncbi:hypothetical protein F4813DRAFT_400765 [Daldinia decipiens]|uniref:uncharacterized protein n=1 Tax=Daldinia decipiens TaxID=326647 RepID=UPI0020C36903|nr:uncharacterized protein F4813DRAFT_400765 [Daldinia decipiens]KAI1660623.1 hypothetical protein F4813DRAFT_400765 [Daldinia decipiens]